MAMDTHNDMVPEVACRLASEMPMPVIRIVAKIIRESPSLALARERMIELPQPHHRQLVVEFLDNCLDATPPVQPEPVALALVTAGISEKAHRGAQSVELVWTGPDTGAVPFRRTEQAILQVLDSASQTITLVSYAVHRIPNICEAIVHAARRNVKITIIVETPDRIVGQQEYSTLRALGPEVAACSTVYFWPQESRGSHGERLGILHVKCAVADSRWLFLSSANLTEYAFSINMELGVLLTGGTLPRKVEENFNRLIAERILKRI
jgi:phosphatidylserine/phosphatidylglycerophosphate/cardiolipin synthase-like enzyme